MHSSKTWYQSGKTGISEQEPLARISTGWEFWWRVGGRLWDEALHVLQPEPQLGHPQNSPLRNELGTGCAHCKYLHKIQLCSFSLLILMLDKGEQEYAGYLFCRQECLGKWQRNLTAQKGTIHFHNPALCNPKICRTDLWNSHNLFPVLIQNIFLHRFLPICVWIQRHDHSSFFVLFSFLLWLHSSQISIKI